MYKSKLDLRDYSPNKPMCLLNAKDIVKEYSLLTDSNGNKLPTKKYLDDEVVSILSSYMNNIGFRHVMVRGNQIFGIAPIFVEIARNNELSVCLEEDDREDPQ